MMRAPKEYLGSHQLEIHLSSQDSKASSLRILQHLGFFNSTQNAVLRSKLKVPICGLVQGASKEGKMSPAAKLEWKCMIKLRPPPGSLS